MQIQNYATGAQSRQKNNVQNDRFRTLFQNNAKLFQQQFWKKQPTLSKKSNLSSSFMERCAKNFLNAIRVIKEALLESKPRTAK